MTDLQKRLGNIREKLAFALLIDGCNELNEDELNGLCHALKDVYDDVIEVLASVDHPAVLHPTMSVVMAKMKGNGNGAHRGAAARPAA